MKTILIVTVLLLGFAMFFYYTPSNKNGDTVPIIPDKKKGISLKVTAAPKNSPQHESEGELIPTDNPDIFLRAIDPPYVDPDPSPELTQWLEKSGYNVMDQFIPIEVVEASSNINLSSDYQTYDLATLKSMSEAGDHRAHLFYGLNLVMDDQPQAIQVFEDTIVNAGYTASFHQIADAYELMRGLKSSAEASEQTSEGNIFPENEIGLMDEDRKQSYIWLLSGKLLNDPFSNQMLDNVQFEQRNSKKTVAALQLLAQDNVRRLNHLRKNRGLAALTSQAPDDNLSHFAKMRIGY